ncbi:L,D-transpeptidase family protein [Tritonibacter scottomollicae]|uniref:Murein L,D-transpeptidase YcbB/YkuD n=1 Tax=Tritonibacter scottomollicae TaxID=483013 RepID=A0A2T1AH96_TRISK|nr:L,D-transpeptidase family protein [Tritonibacter scottomollicae]PRZ47962.1 murein L,D-transpeptidase YcbB/YkuD [Tritonibacter scottomollicae]
MLLACAPKFSSLITGGLLAAVLGASVFFADDAAASSTGFRQAVAEMAWEDEAVASFYRETGYAPLWTADTPEAKARRQAFMQALEEASMHGLPDMSLRASELVAQMRNVRSTRDLGAVEVALSRALVDYATDLQTGLVNTPSSIDEGIVRSKHKVDATGFLSGISSERPYAFLQNLVPASPQYRALMREKMRLEALLSAGGWGAIVPVRKMEPGDTGPTVIALRNRLVAMGYLNPTATRSYDLALEDAVRRFQDEHGLAVDGVAGEGTLNEINRPVTDRIKSVLVAMERERWLTPDRGDRHILVNLTDFAAKIIDDGEITFETRSVIGSNRSDRRTPEFSDVMDHMVINPSWYVPRSIITKEYLPKLKNNPNAHSYIEITDNRGRVVNRNNVDFSQFTARSFPFAMRQPPSSRNALGLVKFMFPNKYNIYLHDTPQKSLFGREVRAFSHGCIRLQKPFEFAYALLARQSDTPKQYFHQVLNSGKETKVTLETKVPVHMIYRTAFVSEDGRAEFRRDIYGRDAKIWSAMERAGVALPGVQG